MLYLQSENFSQTPKNGDLFVNEKGHIFLVADTNIRKGGLNFVFLKKITKASANPKKIKGFFFQNSRIVVEN